MKNKTETPEEKEAFDVMAQDNEAAEAKAKPESGQEIFISQINTDAGIEKHRWFNRQFWCNSGHQNQLFELGLVFTDKAKAGLHTKRLVGLIKQPKPKRTKTEYVQVTESIFDLKDKFERGELYSNYVSVNGVGYELVEDEESFAFNYSNNSLHRKVETEITDREAFIEHTKDIINLINDGFHTAEDVADLLFEANCRLVDGE